MSGKFDNFQRAIREELLKLDRPDLQEVLSSSEKTIKKLSEEGIVSFGPDYKLGGGALEFRVKDIFTKMGFDTESGPIGLHDAIIKPFDGLDPTKPIVVEIKSSKSPSPSRDDLRQLDDWVFELSGEEKARKYGLGDGTDATALSTHGLVVERQYHPSPHKGVMVFNGPLGQTFEKRSSNWLGENEKIFAKKRSFCMISLECLLSWHNEYQRNTAIINDFWSAMHFTDGVLSFHDKRTMI